MYVRNENLSAESNAVHSSCFVIMTGTYCALDKESNKKSQSEEKISFSCV